MHLSSYRKNVALEFRDVSTARPYARLFFPVLSSFIQKLSADRRDLCNLVKVIAASCLTTDLAIIYIVLNSMLTFVLLSDKQGVVLHRLRIYHNLWRRYLERCRYKLKYWQCLQYKSRGKTAVSKYGADSLLALRFRWTAGGGAPRAYQAVSSGQEPKPWPWARWRRPERMPRRTANLADSLSPPPSRCCDLSTFHSHVCLTLFSLSFNVYKYSWLLIFTSYLQNTNEL